MWAMVWFLLLGLSAVLAVLNLTGVIAVNWWWVAAPALGAFAPLPVVGFIGYFVWKQSQED